VQDDGARSHGARDEAAFGQFVADRRPGLLRTAALLTGDRARAEELVQRALTRARRRRQRDADPLAAARRTLVAGTTGWRPRLGHGEQVIESLPDPFAPPRPADDQGLAKALRELPARTRAAAVLAAVDGLDAAALAPLLGTTPETAAAEVAAGSEQLRSTLTPDPYRRQQPASGEEQLRQELLRLAAATGPWRLDGEQATADLGHRRTRTRRRALAAAAAAVLCLTGAGVTLTRPAPTEPGTASPPAATESWTAPPPAARPVSVLAGPTRGSLADDAGFLESVRQVGWGALEPPPPAERVVVLATDTPDGRVVLVVGTVAEDFRGVWLTGPVGAAPDELTPHLPAQLGRTRPVTLLLGGPGPATLVVVAARGDAVEVSERLLTGPRGTVGRSWATVDAVDGVAVVPARTIEDGPAISVRVSRDGRVVHRSGVDWPGNRPGRTTPLPVLTAQRPSSVPPDQQVVAAALTALAVPLATEPADLDPVLLWTGELPLSGGPGTVAVVAAHSTGGALVVTTWAGGRGGAVPCGTSTPPGTTDLDELVVARTCLVDLPGLGPTTDGTWLVVTAPPAVAFAELLDDDGSSLGPLQLTDGSAVVRLPSGASSVVTRDDAGAVVAETTITRRPSEPFGDFGPGSVD